jgi:hypothetical protein
LDIIVGFIGEFELIIDLSELLAAVLDLFLEGEVFLCEVFNVHILLAYLLLQSPLLLFALLQLLLGLEDLLLVDSSLLLQLVSVQQFLLHFLQLQSQFLLFKLFLLLLLVSQLFFHLKFLLFLNVLSQDIILLLFKLVLLLLKPCRNVLGLLFHFFLYDNTTLHGQLSF